MIAAIGKRWAKLLFATADSFDAEFARELGLVHYLARDEAELDAHMERLKKLAMAAAPGAVADVKTLVDHVGGHRIDDALCRDTARRIAARRTSVEGKEGVQAFMARRKPEWDR